MWCLHIRGDVRFFGSSWVLMYCIRPPPVIPEPAACQVAGLTRRAAWPADTVAVSRVHRNSAYHLRGQTRETCVRKTSLEGSHRTSWLIVYFRDCRTTTPLKTENTVQHAERQTEPAPCLVPGFFTRRAARHHDTAAVSRVHLIMAVLTI